MKNKSSILFAVLVWSLLVVRFGYRFGTGDHVEYLPYVLYLQDHSLYAHDFFVQSLSAKVPNERSVVCEFLSLFDNHLEAACFLLQFLATVFLILGLQKLGEVITGNINVARIAVLINFFLLFDRGLGNVELYSDAVQASSISVAIIVFALWYFFRNRFVNAAVLMSIASVIHPVEGLTVYIVLWATLLAITISGVSADRITFLKFIGIYALTAGIFIALLLHEKFDGTSLPSETFYRIYHEFRHPHHYVFAYLPLIEKLLFIFFSAVIVFFGSTGNIKMLWFGIFSVAGTLAYILCSDTLHIPQITNLQFYKVSQWVKFMGVLLLVKTICSSLSKTSMSIWKSSWSYSLVFIVGIASLSLMVFKPSFAERPGIFHQYGNDWKTKEDVVEISLQVERNVSRESVFIQPFECTELKYFGKVSSWVDWKAFVKDQSKIEDWYQRIQLVYGISVDNKEKGFALQKKAGEYFFHLDKAQLDLLKQKGVTHLLTRKEFPCSAGTLILSNNTYAIYQL